jgi:LuxR family transcriptional regulator, maltose regulon positive regulatory protein
VTSLLPTKFFLPPAPNGFVARPQLRKKLDEVLTHRLTLVSAPAGAGKTTLVSDWVGSVQKKGAACGWLSLDEADNTPERFLEYLVACLEEAGLMIDPTRLPGDGGGIRKEETVLAEIIRGLVSIRRAVILVLDDYHLIHSAEIHTALEVLIERAPTCLHLVILTRSDPPFALARLRVAGQMLELRMDQLRFTEAEAAEFLSKASGMDLPDHEVCALNARTEGWVAGLQMAAISMRGREDVTSFVSAFTASNRYVFDYLLEQALNRQPREVREFLLKTSVLDRLTAPLCDAVAESGNSARSMFELLEKENLFLIPLDDERGWYRYHHLFANLLQLLLEREYPDMQVDLYRRACRWYESRGLLPQALQYALASGDMQLVAQIVSANVLILVENDEVAPVLEKIDALSLNHLLTNPWLAIARAWVLSTGQIEKSHQMLDVVEKQIDDVKDEDECRRMRGHIAAVRAYLYTTQRQVIPAIENARQANELLPMEDAAVRAMNLDNLGDALLLGQNTSDAIQAMEQARELAMQAKKPHIAVIALASIGYTHLASGRLYAAHRVCQEALAIAEDYQKQYQRPLAAAADAYAIHSRVLSEWNRNDEAILIAQKALKLSELWGQAHSQSSSLLGLGRILACVNAWGQAGPLLGRGIALAQNVSLAYWQNSITFTLETYLDREVPDMIAIKELKSWFLDHHTELSPILAARLALKELRPDETLAILEQATERLDREPFLFSVRIFILQALAYHAKREIQPALLCLQKALTLGEPENRIGSFVREGSALENLLRVAKASGFSSPFLQRLLSAFESRRMAGGTRALLAQTPVETGAQVEPAALIEPLSERELEVLQHLNSYLSTPEIADLLVVSANTVRTHIKNIYGKLGVHGRGGAVKRGRELGLIH